MSNQTKRAYKIKPEPQDRAIYSEPSQMASPPYSYGPPRSTWEYAPQTPKYESPTVRGLLLMLVAGFLFFIGTLIPFCGLLVIVGMVIAVWGFMKIYNDRSSYDEPHPSNTELAMKFYIIGWIIVIAVVIFIIAEAFSFAQKVIDEEASISEAFGTLLLNALYASVVGFVGTLFIVLARFKLLIGLMPPNRRNILYLAVILVVIISIIVIAVNFAIYDQNTDSFKEKEEEIFGDDENLSRTERHEKNQELLGEFEAEMQGLQWLANGLSAFTYLLFILCFYLAYDYQKQNPQLRKDRYPPQPPSGPPYPRGPLEPRPTQYENEYNINRWGYSDKLKI